MSRPLVSVCIPNYNYGRFVAQAIESAFAQRDADVEVVVADDGSTDESLDVLAGYEDRITLVRQPNGGHGAALNAAFQASRGELVQFLDADDYLDPDCVARAVDALGDAVKVHWRMRLVDGDGNEFGVSPSYGTPLARGSVVHDVVTTGWYSTPPTSGNLFRRSALEQVMPIPQQDFRSRGEAYLLLGTAFLGDVAAIDDPLVSYRVHGANDFAAHGSIDEAALRRRLEHADVLDRYLRELAGRHGYDVPLGVVSGTPEFRLMRLLVGRLADGRRPSLRAGLDLSLAALRSQHMRRRRRVLMAATGPLLPVLPDDALRHLRDVTFAGKPMRPARRRG